MGVLNHRVLAVLDIPRGRTSRQPSEAKLSYFPVPETLERSERLDTQMQEPQKIRGLLGLSL